MSAFAKFMPKIAAFYKRQISQLSGNLENLIFHTKARGWRSLLGNKQAIVLYIFF
jgi:hypothetical protein